MTHELSDEDLEFLSQLESCAFPVKAFDHRAHVRLGYIYLSNQDADSAHGSMRDALKNFLDHNGIDISKYHETLTRAWILAVRHFMEKTPDTKSSDQFIENNPILLDSRIMMTHYSAESIFSDEARQKFVEPDLDPIPRYEDQNSKTKS